MVANWKSTKLPLNDLLDMIFEIKKAIRKYKGELIICPPFPYLEYVRQEIGKNRICLGAQNVASKDNGRQTGEVTAPILTEVGVSHCIVGHSERNEGREEVTEKVIQLVQHRVHPIICVGEKGQGNSDIKDADALREIQEELIFVIKEVSPKDITRCIIAYEPKWAIGGSAEAVIESDLLHQRVLFIRKLLKERYGRSIAFNVPILYGGSVKAENISKLESIGVTNGYLVGSASVDEEFLRIISEVSSTKKITKG